MLTGSALQKTILGCGAVALLVGLALALSLLIAGQIPTASIYLFLAAVVISGGLVGRGHGLLAALFSVLTLDYFFLPPLHTLGIGRAALPYAIPYLLAALTASWLSSSYKRIEASQKENIRLATAAEEASERFRAAFEDAPFGMCLTSLGGCFLQVNRALCHMLGYSREELLGTEWSSITHPDDLSMSREAAVRLHGGEVTPEQLEKRYIRGDGRVVTVKVTISAVQDGQGRPSYYITHVEDITEQRKAAESLRASEERYRSLVMNIPDVVWTADATGRTTFISPNVESMSGYTIEEAYEKGPTLFMERLHPGDAAKVSDAIQAVMTTGERREMECRLQRKDGEWIWLHNRAIGCYEREGVRYVVGLISDISERKRAEAENNRLAAALSQAGEGIVITDFEGTIQYVNPAFSQITGYSAAEVIGRNPRMLKSGRQDPAYYSKLWQTIRDGHVWEGELVNRRKDGTHYTEEMTVAPVRDSSGSVTNFVGIKRDITDRKAASEALYHSRQLLQSVLDNIPQRVFWKDRNSNFLGCNRAFATDVGLNEASEIVGENDFAFTWKESADAFRADDQLVMATESPKLNYEERRDSARASGQWVRTNKVPLRDQKGAVIGVLGTYEDITEQRQAAQTRAFLASIVESSKDAIIGKTLDGTVVSWNRGAEVLYGYPGREVIGQNVSLLVPPELKPETAQILDRIKQGKATSHFETRRLRKDGGSVDVSLNVSPIRDASGEVIGAATIARDISERKQAEEALRKSEEQFRELAENIREVFFVSTPEPVRVTYLSPAYEEIWGRSRQDVYDRTNAWIESICPEDREQALATFADSQRGTATDTEYRIMRPDGSLRWIRNRTFPLRDSEGQFYRVVGTAEDITERKQAEEALLFKNALLEAQSETTLDGILAVDEAAKVVLYNRQFALLWRIPDAILATGDDVPLLEQVTKQLKDPDRFLARVKYLYGHPSERGEDELRLNDGRTIDRYSAPLVDSNGRHRGRIWYFRDITERKQAAGALQRSEERARLLFATIPHPVWVYDLKTLKFLEVNEEAERRYGYSRDEFLRLKITDIRPPEEAEKLRQELRRPRAPHEVSDSWKHRSKDGRIFNVEISSHTLDYDGRRAVLVVAMDITDRRRMEIELRQAQKLEAVGQLAAGIAHEINTPIQFVGDNTRFLAQSFQDVQKLLHVYENLTEAAAGSVEDGILRAVKEARTEVDWEYLKPEIPKALEQTLDGVNRVAKIVRAMRDFSHVGQSGQRAAADLNKALDSTLTVARNELKYVADVVTDFRDIPAVVCDLGEINQVFLNLLINAAHAIGDVVKGTGQKGTIGVKTWQDDGYVVVAVSDTGTGIPEAVQGRIFDPFFTTKDVGKGTGQGLTLARGVVERHSGSLTFETSIGKGTTFFVRLPIIHPKPPVQSTRQYESHSVCR
jgi:PAS domain S-box-containing protein